jgi:hypothetical protein
VLKASQVVGQALRVDVGLVGNFGPVGGTGRHRDQDCVVVGVVADVALLANQRLAFAVEDPRGIEQVSSHVLAQRTAGVDLGEVAPTAFRQGCLRQGNPSSIADLQAPDRRLRCTWHQCEAAIPQWRNATCESIDAWPR